jgi:hypothetical protein
MQPMASAARLLCIGPDPVLLKTRKWVLETRFQVEIAFTVSGVQEVVSKQRFDEVVLCHSLRHRERLAISELVKLNNRSATILQLGFATSDRSFRNQNVVEEIPSALLEKISGLIGRLGRLFSPWLLPRWVRPIFDIARRAVTHSFAASDKAFFIAISYRFLAFTLGGAQAAAWGITSVNGLPGVPRSRRHKEKGRSGHSALNRFLVSRALTREIQNHSLRRKIPWRPLLDAVFISAASLRIRNSQRK